VYLTACVNVDYSFQIDAKLIARDTEFVEKGKRGKHDFFGKSRLVCFPRTEIAASYRYRFSSSRSDETEIDSAHPSKRVKIDTQDIADKVCTQTHSRNQFLPVCAI
jgi:chromosome transmission fidelity protein 18